MPDARTRGLIRRAHARATTMRLAEAELALLEAALATQTLLAAIKTARMFIRDGAPELADTALVDGINAAHHQIHHTKEKTHDHR